MLRYPITGIAGCCARATIGHTGALPSPRGTSGGSLDHLVGGRQQRFRDGEAECLGGLEIDDKINFCDLLHREVGRLVAFENAPGIDANLAVIIVEAAAIAHQAAGQDVLTDGKIAGSAWRAASAA